MPYKQKYWGNFLEKLKADPIKYEAYLENNRQRAIKRRTMIKNDPVKHKKNVEYSKEYNSKYEKTEKGKRFRKINSWKHLGIIDSDFDLLYDYYILQTNCMICGIEFKNTKDRHLDHNHINGEVRYICCQNCNTNFLRDK